MKTFTVDVDQESLRKLKASLATLSGNLDRHMATAINRTARTVGVEAAQQLGKVVNFKIHPTNKVSDKKYSKAKTLKKAVWQKQNATPDNPRTAIKLWGGYPFPLRFHEAKQFQRKRKGKVRFEGVQYRTNVGGGWTTILDAFIVKRFGGNVYKRQEGARSIRKLTGKSPADYFAQAGIGPIAAKLAAERLPIEIKRRLREVTLAAEGKIKLRSEPDLGNLK